MKIFLILMMCLSFTAFAHDEGHGPKLTDAPKQGGMVASVVLAKEANKGPKAELIYKAEITRSTDGTVKVYFYDKNMAPLKSGTLASKAKALLITEKKGKISTQPFELTFIDDHFQGKSPKPARRPYNIDIKVMDGQRELLVAFDNLD